MKRFLSPLVLAAMLGWAGADARATETIKLCTLAPEGSPWYEIMREMADGWREGSKGEVELRIYPGGVCGDEPDMVRKMRVGQLQAAALTAVGLASIVPDMQVFQMPMLLRSDAELDFVRERIGGRLERQLESKGFKLLTWGDAGWVYLFARQPVTDPAALKPLRLFVWSGDTAYAEALKDAGYQPVPLAATELHTALQSGLVGALPATPIAALSFQWFGVAKHMTDLPWAPLVGAVVISNAKWKAFPEATRTAIADVSRQGGAKLAAAVRNLGEQAVGVMKQHGLEVHSVSPAVAEKWEREVRAGYPKIIGPVVPKATADEVQRLVQEYRTVHKGS